MSLIWNSSHTDQKHLFDVQPSWLENTYQAFSDRLSSQDPAYPCHFGTRSQQDGLNWFTAVDQSTGPAAADLARAVIAFQAQAWAGPKRQSLIAFVGPPDPELDFDRDYRQFWNLLAELTALDRQPWPEDRRIDAVDPRWEWCFAGEPWFVFCCSPAYRQRKSRNLGPCLTIVFQVRRVFEGLSGSSPAGQAAKKRVRDRLLTYDAIGPHPHLGDDQHSSVFKWRQYMLPDDQRLQEPGQCPFRPAGRAGRPLLNVTNVGQN